MSRNKINFVWLKFSGCSYLVVVAVGTGNDSRVAVVVKSGNKFNLVRRVCVSMCMRVCIFACVCACVCACERESSIIELSYLNKWVAVSIGRLLNRQII